MTALTSRASAAAAPALLAIAIASSSCTTVADDPIPATPKPISYAQQPGGRYVACTDCDRPTRKTLATVRATPVATHITVLPPASPASAASQVGQGTSAWTPPADRPVAAAAEDPTLHERATIDFRFDTAALNPAARAKLTQLAPLFRAASRIRMLGFTDDVGPQGPNDKLAAARAMAVHLFVRGLVQDATSPVLTSRGDALCCYLTDNRNEAQRSINRRVEVLVSLPDTARSKELVRQVARLLVPTGALASDAKRLADARPIETSASAVPAPASRTQQ